MSMVGLGGRKLSRRERGTQAEGREVDEGEQEGQGRQEGQGGH